MKNFNTRMIRDRTMPLLWMSLRPFYRITEKKRKTNPRLSKDEKKRKRKTNPRSSRAM